MRFALQIEAQRGLSYEEQLASARRAQDVGFEAWFRSDHYSGRPDDQTTDALAVLAGLARDTKRIRLGTLVSPVTFRLPGNLAKAAATVQEMSGGRLELGFGAGHNESEHRRHGFRYPEIAERAEMLEEQLEIVRGLWTGDDGWSFRGRHYVVDDARFRARPEPRPSIIVGGRTARSMRLAARFADDFNMAVGDPGQTAEKVKQFDAICRAMGRDPRTITHSAMVGTLIGRDEHEFRRRALAAGLDPDASDGSFERRRAGGIIGTPDEAREMIRRYAEAGIQRIMLQLYLPRDLVMVDLLGRELLGRT
jgi:alkanesulfonate monooxygenase SsuD/methylene tetrahydromethanopterin reductase-like flavin-dependent oxidoreductase (luciferase family)